MAKIYAFAFLLICVGGSFGDGNKKIEPINVQSELNPLLPINGKPNPVVSQVADSVKPAAKVQLEGTEPVDPLQPVQILKVDESVTVPAEQSDALESANDGLETAETIWRRGYGTIYPGIYGGGWRRPYGGYGGGIYGYRRYYGGWGRGW